jgi:hypothetical protein
MLSTFIHLAFRQLDVYVTVTGISHLQDWVFFDRGSLQLTLELHEQMKPPPQQLPAMWQLNKPALLRFAELVSGTWQTAVQWLCIMRCICTA